MKRSDDTETLMLNAARAERAAETLRFFLDTDDQLEAFTDLLVDLRHWCDREGFDFDKEVKGSLMHFKAELAGEP